MKKIQLLLLIPTCSLLASCLGAAMQGAIDGFNNKPEIRYSTKQVTIAMREEPKTSLKAGQKIYFASDIHGVIAEDILRPSQNNKVFAKFSLPDKKPVSKDPACFYLTLDGARSISRSSKGGNVGFYNPTWESIFGKKSQLRTLSQENKQLKEEKSVLKAQLQAANSYLKITGNYINGQCVLSQNSNPQPSSIYSTEFWEFEDLMPYAACLNVKLPGVSNKTTQFLTKPGVNKFLYKNMQRFHSATAQYSSEAAVKQSKMEIDTIANDSMNKRFRSSTCSSFSKCSILEELYFGSPLRSYATAFEACLKATKQHIAQQSGQYREALAKWEKAPYLDKQQCQAQLEISTQAPDRLKQINTQLISNTNHMQHLSKKPDLKGTTYTQEADKTSCVPKA